MPDEKRNVDGAPKGLGLVDARGNPLPLSTQAVLVRNAVEAKWESHMNAAFGDTAAKRITNIHDFEQGGSEKRAAMAWSVLRFEAPEYYAAHQAEDPRHLSAPSPLPVVPTHAEPIEVTAEELPQSDDPHMDGLTRLMARVTGAEEPLNPTSHLLSMREAYQAEQKRRAKQKPHANPVVDTGFELVSHTGELPENTGRDWLKLAADTQQNKQNPTELG